MNKIIIFFTLLILPIFASAEEMKLSDLKQECFVKSASFLLSSSDVSKVKVKKEQILFFVQDDSFLPYKLFETGQEKNINYKLTSYTTGPVDIRDDAKYLQDGNLETSFVLNAYPQLSKQIIIDAGEILKANMFSFQLNYRGNLQPSYYASLDGDTFAKINQYVEGYDWRYLKIIFNNSGSDNSVNENLAIQELSLTTASDDVFLIKPLHNKKVDIYADYRCNDFGKVQKIMNDVEKKSGLTIFSVNIDSKIYDAELGNNSLYNNDFDNDNVVNDVDNCPFVMNNNQLDVDSDLVGDVCDFNNGKKNFNDKDSDYDGIGNSLDNCVYIYNPNQLDSNSDKIGDLCADDDGDGIVGYKDNCKDVANSSQVDINVNNIGDACEFDKDKDGVFDNFDNCINIVNVDQKDSDSDSIGDVCDNCDLYNPQQIDMNNNGSGDVCEDAVKNLIDNDEDKDGVLNNMDNCQRKPNLNQEDFDKDGVGDVCDNCVRLQNPNQEDLNNNIIGDLCEDGDNDGLEGYLDNCMYGKNPHQEDSDNDGVGNICEDDDSDSVLAEADNCPNNFNSDQADIDRDGTGDVCDKKDDRFIESNKTLFITLISVLSFVFLGLIIFLTKRMDLLLPNDDKAEAIKKDPKTE